MKFTQDEAERVKKVIETLSEGCESFIEYAPLMAFDSKTDKEKVVKGLSILKSKIEGIREADNYDELKQFLKVKKIVKEYREDQVRV